MKNPLCLSQGRDRAKAKVLLAALQLVPPEISKELVLVVGTLGAEVLSFGNSWQRRRASFALTLPCGTPRNEVQLEVPIAALSNLHSLSYRSFWHVSTTQFGDYLGNEADGSECTYQMSALVVCSKAKSLRHVVRQIALGCSQQPTGRSFSQGRGVVRLCGFYS